MKTFSSGHVLLVDDDPFVRQSVEMVMSAHGLKVTPSGSAREALALVEGTDFDYGIIDVGMPEINGIELCREIRSKPGIKQFPILMLSGFADKKTKEQALQSGANDFLNKPFSLETILKILKKYETEKE